MIGQTIGHYEILELIGRGGMGEVFRARDVKLGRDVAMKILPTEFRDDRERLARFEREARLLASLQHQNIAAIYGLEAVDGRPILVMELAAGEDLSDRLAHGQLPDDEIEQITRQLAKGLEYAHDVGIVHRDLKPANVKVSRNGKVKILDFGLARALTGDSVQASEQSDSNHSPTVTQALTGAGTILGTAAYMSPEQARGREVDRRTDIWAFGVILYEMLAGKRLFDGETTTDILAAILRKQPDWEVLPEASPVLSQLCRRCLEKDPQQRLRDIGEARIALEGSSSSMVGVTTDIFAPQENRNRSHRRPLLPWLVVAALAVSLAVVGTLTALGKLGPQMQPSRLVRSEVRLPDGVNVYLNPAFPGPVKVSPDGRHLAFAGRDSTGQAMLYLRTLDQRDARAIPGTREAAYPFWSPDSRTVAFFSDNDLRRVEIRGGPVVTICPAENGKGGSWSSDGTILFAPTHNSPLHHVSAEGGTSQPVTDIAAGDGDRSHRFPVWLPDGEHFIYLAWSQARRSSPGADAALRVGSLDGSLDRELMPCQTNAVFASGQLLFVHDRNLMARPFSLDKLDFAGPARALEEGVLMLREAHAGVFSAVDRGVLAYSRGDGRFGLSRHQWVSPDGVEGEVIGEPIYPMGVACSPQGDQVAIAIVDGRNGTFDIWIHDVARSLRTRFTFASETENRPVWSPDGRWLTYSSDQTGISKIYRKRISGAGQPELLVDRESDCLPASWSPDGTLLCFTENDQNGDAGIWLLDTAGDRELRVFRDTEFGEWGGTFSPDGRWLVYTCDETGGFEVFVESLDPDGGRWRISSAGGLWPLWSADGKRIYYLTIAGALEATTVELQSDGLRIGDTVRVTSGVDATVVRSYTENPVTGQLLVQRQDENQPTTSLTLVTGWQQALARIKQY